MNDPVASGGINTPTGSARGWLNIVACGQHMLGSISKSSRPAAAAEAAAAAAATSFVWMSYHANIAGTACQRSGICVMAQHHCQRRIMQQVAPAV
jgi:hypothetical protein